MDSLHSLFRYTVPSVENRPLAHSYRRRVHTPPAASFASDSTYSSAHNLIPVAGGAHCGLVVASHAAQEARDKPRRPTQSAWTSYHRNVVSLPKPAGKYGSIAQKIMGKQVVLSIV